MIWLNATQNALATKSACLNAVATLPVVKRVSLDHFYRSSHRLNAFLACPCGKNCPVGCSGCDHPLCIEPPSTDPPTTESSTETSSTESSSSSTSKSTSRTTSSTRSHPTTSSTTKSSSITRTLTTSRTSRSTLPSLPDSRCGAMYSCGEPISQGVSA